MKKKITILFVGIILVFLILTNRLNIVLYDDPMNPSTYILGDYEITTRSITEIVSPSHADSNYCQYVRTQYYDNPSVNIKNVQNGQMKKYRIKSDINNTRIVLGPQITSEDQGFADISVKVMTVSGKYCTGYKWIGSFVITDEGNVYPQNLPIKTKKSDVYIVSNDNKKMYLVLANNNSSQGWNGDFNNDGISDFFFTEINPEDESSSITYMWEVKENRMAQWFNNGQPVFHEKTGEEINDTWTARQAFINLHISE